MQDLRDYIKSMYLIAKSDYKLARTEETKHKALKEMLRLTTLASKEFGFEFADSLKTL